MSFSSGKNDEVDKFGINLKIKNKKKSSKPHKENIDFYNENEPSVK